MILRCVALALLSPLPAAGTIFVDASASGAADGTSWADAFAHLQDGLAAAQAGDEVWVARGTYRADLGAGLVAGDRTASFHVPDGVDVYGGFDGTEAALSSRAGLFDETVLDGDLLGDDATVGNAENTLVIVDTSGVGPGTRLDGFTIRGGNANAPFVASSGAGLANTDGSPHVANCRFVENRSSGSGGAVRSSASGHHPVFERCTFVGNESTNDGGAVYVNNGPPFFVSCRFVGNRSGNLGGAISMFATSGSGPSGMVPLLANCLFSGNVAVMRGGGLHATTATFPDIVGCTFASNLAGSAVGAAVSLFHGGAMVDCVVWGNTAVGGAGEDAQVFGPLSIDYSCIEGWTGSKGGTGNHGLDPCFVDLDGADDVAGTVDDDLRLHLASPCIDAGDNAGLPGDFLDLDGDGDVVESLPLDLAEGSRQGDEALVTDTGAGVAPIVDMGAFEFAPPAPLYADAKSLSLFHGGAQTLLLAVDPSFAGRLYLVLGSLAGTSPGIVFDGAAIPLNVDAYTLYTLQSPSSRPLSTSLGLIDGAGTATASFSMPPASPPNLAGLTAHHAAVVLDFSLPAPILLATNAVSLEVLP